MEILCHVIIKNCNLKHNPSKNNFRISNSFRCRWNLCARCNKIHFLFFPLFVASKQLYFKVIDEEKLQENSLNVGTYLLKGLEQLRDKYPVVGDVRGKVRKVYSFNSTSSTFVLSVSCFDSLNIGLLNAELDAPTL